MLQEIDLSVKVEFSFGDQLGEAGGALCLGAEDLDMNPSFGHLLAW